MKLNYVHPIWLGLTLAALISVTACGDYSVRLPGGYSLVRIYAGAVLISHSEKGVVIDANIDSYKILDGLIVGHVTAADLPPEKSFSKPGYFILNTKTHDVKQGLEKRAWLNALQTLGVTSEPSLSGPSRFDRDY